MKNTEPKTLFVVIVTHAEGYQSLMTHRNRMEWSKRTAQKHAREFVARHPGNMAEIQEGMGSARI